jgi:hypothetical protein
MTKYAMKRKTTGCEVMFISVWLELGRGKPFPICKLDLHWTLKLYLKTSHQPKTWHTAIISYYSDHYLGR